MPPRQKFKATKCRFINAPQMLMWCDEATLMTSWRAKGPDDILLKPNFSDDYEKVKNVPGFKYYLAEMEDLASLCVERNKCESEEEKVQKTIELMSTVTDFSKQFTKRIFIRSIPPGKHGSKESFGVFPDEILEMIPILMKQQGTPISDNDERLEKYRELYKQQVPHLYKTIEIAEFTKILQEFDINKKKVTIVQDPGHELSRQRQMATGIDETKLFTPDMKLVVDTSQAVFMVLQGLLCGVNWTEDKCKDHEDCLKLLKPKVMALMKEFMELEKGTYVTLKYVITSILRLKQECPDTFNAPKNVTNFDFKNQPPENQYNEQLYTLMCMFYGLKSYPNIFERPKILSYMPVWMFRLFLRVAWIDEFFGVEEENAELKEFAMNTVMFVVPEKRKRMTEEFMERLNAGEIVVRPVEPMIAMENLSLEDVVR